MGYFIDPDGNYPRHAGDVQREHPEWIEGRDTLPDGWVDVAPGVMPEAEPGQLVVEIAPAVIDGVMTRQFEIIAEVI